MTSPSVTKPEMAGEYAEPFIESATLPKMDLHAVDSRHVTGKLMDPNAKPLPERKAAKTPVKPRAGKSKASGEMPDQVSDVTARSKQPSARRVGGRVESYVRLRIRLRNGEMSLIDAREIEGPVSMPESLPTGYACEVTRGEKRIAVGAIPDLAEWRSYPSPSGPEEMQVHHVHAEPEAEFSVRVPRTELSLAALPKTVVTLYQVKDPAPGQAITREASLSQSFPSELREVAQMKGIKMSELSSSAQREMRKILK